MAHLYEQVRGRVIEAISTGRWRAGEAIPTEAELAIAFKVSIGTVRKAVDDLVAQQALVRRQGKGTFVAAHDGRRLMYHFFHIVPREGRKSYPTVRTLSFRRDRAREDDAEALAISPSDKVIRIRNVLSLSGVPVIMDDITLPAEPFRGLTEKIFLARNNTIYHLHLRAILANRDVAQALDVAPGTPLLEIRRVALTFRDRPVELRISRVNTAHHDYHNTLGKEV
jgi:GntR family transcriptional regulator